MQAYSITPFSQAVVVPALNPNTQKYDGSWWQTLVQLGYIVNEKEFNIEPGFLTDFGSIPSIARSIVSPSDQSLMGFLGHDFLYGDNNPTDFTKAEADEFLFILALTNGQDYTKAWMTRKAVAWFGSRNYKRKDNVFIPVDEDLLIKINLDNNFKQPA
jgi:hypothetical protein